jgi:hypothetical protein
MDRFAGTARESFSKLIIAVSSLREGVELLRQPKPPCICHCPYFQSTQRLDMNLLVNLK